MAGLVPAIHAWPCH